MLKVKLIKKAIKNCRKHGIELTLIQKYYSSVFTIGEAYYFCANDNESLVTWHKLWRLSRTKNKEEIQYILGMDIGERDD